MLSAAQQSVAVLAYIKNRLIADHGDASLLQDPFFLANLDYSFAALFEIYSAIYGHRHDCLESLVVLARVLAEHWSDRPEWLKQTDRTRLLKSTWYTSNKMVGGTCYVDLYAKNLRGLRDKIPYFRELGLTYLHIMPPYKQPGRFAEEGIQAMSYRQVDEKLGSMYELSDLAKELSEAGISLALDVAISYTSDQHEWARKASEGDAEHTGFYWISSDRAGLMATRHDRQDAESKICQMRDGRWVATAKQSDQWQLNFTNPAVLKSIVTEILSLANTGATIFKLDAIEAIWTHSNAIQSTRLVEALNLVCRIAAPSVLLQHGTTAHSAKMLDYASPSACQLSENALQMSATWEALATRKVCTLQQVMERWNTATAAQAGHWVNYVRSPEELSWLFTDQEAHEHLVDPANHRRFLNSFYIKRYPGSFARGLAFRDDPHMLNCRVSGTTASLAGLESGEENAVERILLLYSICFSSGGIPMINLGDEVGQLNDYHMPSEKGAEHDSRWVHRPAYPAKRYEEKRDKESDVGRLFEGMRRLIDLRKKTDELAGGKLVGFHSGNPHILGYQRYVGRSKVLILCNFNDHAEKVHAERFAALPAQVVDLVTDKQVEARRHGLELEPHQYAWLRYE